MIRVLIALVIGWIVGVVSDRMFPGSLPRTPEVVQSAATSLGLKPAPAAFHVSQTPSSRLSASVNAEISRNYDEALKELATYRDSGGDPFLASERAGWLFYLKGAYPQAEQAYGEASRMHPGALNPLLGILNAAEAMKDEYKMRRAAELVLRIDPSNYRASMLLGGKSFAAHDYAGAAFIYRKVLSLYPDDVDARSGLAWGEYYTGDSHDALVQFETILETYPDYPWAKQGYKLVSGVNGRGSPAPR